MAGVAEPVAQLSIRLTPRAARERLAPADAGGFVAHVAGYNESGRQGPAVAGRDEGYLFWLAWLQHNGAALFSSSDANGPFRPVTLGGTCTVLRELTGDNPPLNLLFQPALLDNRVCGTK